MNRKPPKIDFLKPEQGYALFLAGNYDYYQEALNYIGPPSIYDRMRAAKDKAIALDERRTAIVPIEFGGEHFDMQAKGLSGGIEYVLINDDLRIHFGSRNKEWSITWRATAAALWEYGVHALIERAHQLFWKEKFQPLRPNERCISLSRVDYAFDFYSPAFSTEMSPQIINSIVAHSETKFKFNGYGKTAENENGEVKIQTLTCGSKAGCEVQIYDKAAEIVEASGKEWMYDIWARAEGFAPENMRDHIWRLEVRMSGKWLKGRTGKDPKEFFENEYSLIADALYHRRLTVASETDNNRWRAPMHPLYTLAIEHLKNPTEFVPIGHQVTGRRDEMVARQEINVAGSIRSLLVLKYGDVPITEEMVSEINEELKELMLADSEHAAKVEKAQYRYANVEEAQ